MNKLRNELFEKGYVKISKLIDKDILKEINKFTTELVNNQSDEDKKKQISTGSMINVTISEKFTNLIANKKLIKKFEEMGYSNPKWASGYIIGKSSNSAPLYWHNDWWAWDDPISFVKAISTIRCKIVEQLNFEDHFNYNQITWDTIEDLSSKLDVEFILTTEKDWIKIKSLKVKTSIIDLSLKINFRRSEEFFDVLNQIH